MEHDEKALDRHTRDLAALKEIAEALNRHVHLHRALDETLALLVKLMELETAWVFLLEPDSRFHLAAHHDLPPALQYPGPRWEGGCSCQWMCEGGELTTAINIVECSRLKSARGDRRGLRYHASVPLRSEAAVVGILNVASPRWDLFTGEALQVLSNIGYQLGTAIARARLFEESTRLAMLDERTRLAREIHDTLAQGLAAITLQLETAELLFEPDPARARQMIERALRQARLSLEDARRSVMDLRAAPLQNQPLDQALEALASQACEELGIAVSCRCQLAGKRLPTWLEFGLYRIAQEALNNIGKHAMASQAQLSLTREKGAVTLVVGDNGRGFDPGRVLGQQERVSFGIIGMIERAKLLGGQLSVESAPGAGTTITARVPIK